MTDLDEKIDFVSRVTIKRSIPSMFEIPLLKNLIELDEDTWKKFKSGYSPVSLVISAILCIISAGSIMSHLSRVIKFTYEDVKIERWCCVVVNAVILVQYVGTILYMYLTGNAWTGIFIYLGFNLMAVYPTIRTVRLENVIIIDELLTKIKNEKSNSSNNTSDSGTGTSS